MTLESNPGSYCDIISTSFEIRNNKSNSLKFLPIHLNFTTKMLSEINLRSRNIGDYEIKFLSEALINDETITKLHLSDNHIGDSGAQQLADALRNNNVGYF